MLVLALSIAWLSFLVSFSMYSGLLVLVLVVRLFQCFILVFSFFSLSMSSSHFSLLLCLIIFFRASFFSFRCHLCSWFCSIISIVFSIHLLSPVVLSFIRELSVFSSTLLACIILFIFISCFMGINPVSMRSIVLGVPCGRFIVVFIAVLNIFWICCSSFLSGPMVLSCRSILGRLLLRCIAISLSFSFL